MGVSRPVGFKGEIKILPRSSRPAVTRQQTQKEILIPRSDSDSSCQDAKKELMDEIYFLNKIIKNGNSIVSRDSGICEDFDLPTSDKVSKFPGKNIGKILTLRRPTYQSWHIKVFFSSHGSA